MFTWKLLFILCVDREWGWGWGWGSREEHIPPGFQYFFLTNEKLFEPATYSCVIALQESILDASEDSQLQAAIAASLTYTQSANNCSESDDDDDDDDMGFSDSNSEDQPSPKKISTTHGSKIEEKIPTKEETKSKNNSKRTSLKTIPEKVYQTRPTRSETSEAAEASSHDAGSTREETTSVQNSVCEVETKKNIKLDNNCTDGESLQEQPTGEWCYQQGYGANSVVLYGVWK